MDLSTPLYSALPDVLSALDRLRPKRFLDWPAPFGGVPPNEVVSRYPRYEAVALAHRLRSRSLQAAAFRVTPSTLKTYVDRDVIYDRHTFFRWTQGGRGAIFACPHYGPFLSGALLLASRGNPGNPLHVFYDAAESVPENERFDTFFKNFEGSLNVLHNQPGDLIRAARALRSKQCISIMFDVVQRALDCIYVPFFDRLYPAMGGVALLSLLSKAPIIPAYTLPEPNRKICVVFGEPILPENYTSKDRDQNVFAMTSALFRDLERQLMLAPWHWIYWSNLARTTSFQNDMVRSEGDLFAELRHRVQAIPALATISPDLASLFES